MESSMHHLFLDPSNGIDELLSNPKGRMSYPVRLEPKNWMSRTELLLEDRIKKWAGLWRTIILSSLGKTLYPYSQYIRTLHLVKLEELLENSKFEAKIRT